MYKIPTNIDFTDPKRVYERVQKLDGTQAYEPGFYASMGKVLALYKLLSVEKNITDVDFLAQIGEEMKKFGEYDCRPTIDRKGWYKETSVIGKTFKGLIRLIGSKILSGQISQEHGYYLLCRARGNCDPSGNIKDDVEWILQKPQS